MGDLPLTVGQPLFFRFDQLLLSVTVKALSGELEISYEVTCNLSLLLPFSNINGEGRQEVSIRLADW